MIKCVFCISWPYCWNIDQCRNPHKKNSAWSPPSLPSVMFFTSVKSKMATKKNNNKNKNKYSVLGVGGAVVGGGNRGGGPL